MKFKILLYMLKKIKERCSFILGKLISKHVSLRLHVFLYQKSAEFDHARRALADKSEQ